MTAKEGDRNFSSIQDASCRAGHRAANLTIDEKDDQHQQDGDIFFMFHCEPPYSALGGGDHASRKPTWFLGETYLVYRGRRPRRPAGFPPRYEGRRLRFTLQSNDPAVNTRPDGHHKKANRGPCCGRLPGKIHRAPLVPDGVDEVEHKHEGPD